MFPQAEDGHNHAAMAGSPRSRGSDPGWLLSPRMTARFAPAFTAGAGAHGGGGPWPGLVRADAGRVASVRLTCSTASRMSP